MEAEKIVLIICVVCTSFSTPYHLNFEGSLISLLSFILFIVDSDMHLKFEILRCQSFSANWDFWNLTFTFCCGILLLCGMVCAVMLEDCIACSSFSFGY